MTEAAPDAQLLLLNYFNPFPADENENPARPIFNQAGDDLNAVIRDLAGEFNASYVDIATPVRRPRGRADLHRRGRRRRDGPRADPVRRRHRADRQRPPERRRLRLDRRPGHRRPRRGHWTTDTDDDTVGAETGGLTGLVGSPGNGGGLHVTGTADVTFDNSEVARNASANEGGGLWNQAGSTLTVNNTRIFGNTTDGPGGGIYDNGGRTFVNGSTVTGNRADDGGGIFANDGAVVTIDDASSVVNNLPDDLDGPGVFA